MAMLKASRGSYSGKGCLQGPINSRYDYQGFTQYISRKLWRDQRVRVGLLSTKPLDERRS